MLQVSCSLCLDIYVDEFDGCLLIRSDSTEPLLRGYQRKYIKFVYVTPARW